MHTRSRRDLSPLSSATAAINVQPFNRCVGPAVMLSASIAEIFELFFTSALVDLIVEQKNLYVSQMMSDGQYAKWEDVNVEEIYAFMILVESTTYQLSLIIESWIQLI